MEILLKQTKITQYALFSNKVKFLENLQKIENLKFVLNIELF